ncbi:MarR family winged helix-turn-helix transcriptional regulator [Antarctobacter jejuensis]|uniref:MarR family winged helix-turn-helix transcriptional regulator n=1 Tax=Antarctobacter jejuensis TaxID=1439938 RepID=UPI003FCFA4CB
MVGVITSSDEPQAKLGQFLTYRMSRLQAKLNAQASRILRDHAGITITQWRIIAVLGDGGSCTAAQLSRMTAMDKGLISRNVKTLNSEGFITISRDSSDNRALHLNLTDKGHKVFDHTFPRMSARQTALRSYLDEIDPELLLLAFDKLERAAEDPTV